MNGWRLGRQSAPSWRTNPVGAAISVRLVVTTVFRIAAIAISLGAAADSAAVAAERNTHPQIVVLSAHWSPASPFRIRAKGLPRSSLATLVLETHDANGNLWRSRGVWRAGQEGSIDPAASAPIEGTYSTKDPDGLIWSMRQETGTPALYKPPEGDRIPFNLSVTVNGSAVATRTIWRYRAPNGVSRKLLTGPVVGTVFEPADGRKHAAVLLIGGSGGGHPLDDEAAALAGSGYVTLSMAYYNAPGLPDNLVQIPVETALDAVNWLRSLPSVDARRIAVIGHSRGSELAQLVAANDPDVSAVVLLAGSPVGWPGLDPNHLGSDGPAWTLGGSPVPVLASGKCHGDAFRAKRPPIAGFQCALADEERANAAMLPIDRIHGPMLWLSGDDDQVWPSNDLAKRAMAWRSKRGTRADQWVHFPDAGHWFFVDDGPLDHLTTLTLPGRTVAFGGTLEGDAAAAPRTWAVVRKFLHQAFETGNAH